MIKANNSEFEYILKRVTPVLRRIAYKVSRPYPSLGHDDLFQEAMTHLWKAFLAGELRDKTDSYILQGCFFHLKNYIRKARIRSGMVSIEVLCGDDGGSGEETFALRDERAECFRDELHTRLLAETLFYNGFTAREKEVLSLLSQDLTTREIGSRIGVSHVRVVKLIAGLRSKSRKYIDKI